MKTFASNIFAELDVSGSILGYKTIYRESFKFAVQIIRKISDIFLNHLNTNRVLNFLSFCMY